MSVKNLRAAIYAKLNGASSVTSLLASSTAIYHAVAPPEADFPLIVFFQSSGIPSYSFQATNWENSLWTIKAVATADNADTVDDIAGAVETLLTRGSLTITGGTLFGMRRESDLQYVEVEDGQQIRHSGATFRIVYR